MSARLGFVWSDVLSLSWHDFTILWAVEIERRTPAVPPSVPLSDGEVSAMLDDLVTMTAKGALHG